MGSSPTVPTMSIIHRLADIYASPEWAFFTEVRSGMGVAQDLRIADAIAVNTYPSRRLELHGFEMKVSRADFRVELSKPEKAKLAAFCTKWWLVVPAPRKLIIPDLKELPKGWGLFEIGTGSPVTIVEADKREAQPIDDDLLRSLLRAGSVQPAQASEVAGAPMKAINRPDLSRSHVGLVCGHAAARPLDKRMPPKTFCFACGDGVKADVEVAEAMIEDGTDEQIVKLAAVIERQKMIRGIA